MALRSRTSWWGVVLDTPEPRALGRFYERLLGWTVFDDSPEWVTLAPSKDAGYNLAFQKEEKYVRPVWPTAEGEPQMSMHLDIEVDDVKRAVGHAVEVGAEVASYQPQEHVHVMLDPAGHPFCLYLGEPAPAPKAARSPLRTGTDWWGVNLDAPDGRALAHFYARLLGWQVFDENETGAAVTPSENAGYNLAFETERLYARPVWPTEAGRPQMSMHLDIEVDELEQSVGYAVEVGAEVASYQPQEHVRVMLDPAGHPFCLYLGEA